MSYSLMRFGGITLRHNPKELAVKHTKALREHTPIGSAPVLESVSEQSCIIGGKGELYGERCFEMYEKLLRVRFLNKAQVLSIPDMGVYSAVLTKISAKAETHDRLIAVEFEFRTVSMRSAENVTEEEYTLCLEGETLWDIAYRCGVPAEKLAALNTDIRNILSIEEGKKVRIH